MKNSVIAGIVLGVTIAVWTLIFGFTGMYKSIAGAIAFIPVAIAINVGVVVWGLMKTRKEGRGYGGQVAAGLVIGIVGAILIFFNSMLFTQVLFPTYFDDIRVMQGDLLRAAGQSEEAVEEALRVTAESQTPMRQALGGAIPTVVTSLVIALIAAIWIRKKGSA